MEYFAIYPCGLYITRILWHIKSGSFYGAVHLLLILQPDFCYSGILSGYMIINSALTFPSFLWALSIFLILQM